MKNLCFEVNERKLPARERAWYRNLRLRAIAVEPVDDQLRVYPNGSLAAHLLGFVGVSSQVVERKEVNGLVGRYGIEGQFDSYLNGALGWRQTERDRADRELPVFREEDIEARPGLNVVLTIDAGVQDIVESELARGMQMNAPQSISCVVVRPRTGAVVAMASLPAFDPNHPGENTPMSRLRNRVIADTYEPGSTFKAIVVSAALNERVVTLDDIFYCEEGRFSFAGYTLHDAGHHFGNLSVEDIIVKSSNIGAAKVGMKLGPARVYQYIRSFGFGDPTGLALPGEARGLVHPVKDWYKVSIAQIPMGQGLAVTPLQMTMAVSAIANGGRLVRPSVVDRLEDEQNNLVVRYPAQLVRQVISEDTARLMVQALKKVVLAGGTAPKAKLEHYTVAGKTGTGQKPPYGSHKYFSSFVGFFPADDTELCISVFLDEPDPRLYYGGETAGPIFKAIAERAAAYLSIRPDVTPEMPPPEPATSRAERVAQQTAVPLTPAESGRNF
jgi:cell division protein FtsI/penicillin-binding protein 2